MNAQAKPADYLDQEGYWLDPARNLRRMSGEQEIVVRATDECTKAGWTVVIEALCKIVGPLPRSPRQGVI
jgi:hypothetical protein